MSPIVPLGEGDASFPLYCVHPISGDIVGLRDFGDLLEGRRLFGIQVPKDKMTKSFGRSIEGMAGHYVALLTEFQPEGPINLAGWSAGAIIALEMARQLRALGRDVPLLVALDGAPCNTGAGIRVWHPLYTLKLIYNLPRWIRDDRSQDWSWRGILARIESKLACRFGIGGAARTKDEAAMPSLDTMDAETVESVLETSGWTREQKSFIRAMYMATADYVPKAYDGSVVVYETRTQPLYHLRQIGAAWTKIAALTTVVPLRGNHSGLVHQPTIGVIAEDLRERLAMAQIAYCSGWDTATAYSRINAEGVSAASVG